MSFAVPAFLAAVLLASSVSCETPPRMRPGVESHPVCANVHRDYKVDCNWLAAKPPVKVRGSAGRTGVKESGAALARVCIKKFKPSKKLRKCFREGPS